MRKTLLVIGLIWLAIAGGLYAAWWQITRHLTAAEVTQQANRVAQELQIPWSLKFDRVEPRFSSDFRIRLHGMEAVNADGVVVLKSRTVEVRVPWTLVLTRDPGKVRIGLEDVAVGDWKLIVQEVEHWLDARRGDSTREVTLPPHVVASDFDLRLYRVEGAWEGKPLRLHKLYLLNLDPDRPSAFEAVFPWTTSVQGGELSGETTALGEYRVSKDKFDLHYYLRHRLRFQRGNSARTADASLEGKGFYHPRLGFFSTFTGKDDWLAIVGDVEWSREHLKINLPRFAVSHEFLLDLLPFENLRGGDGPYQGTGITGELKWIANAEGHHLAAKVASRPGLVLRTAAGEGPLNINAQWGEGKRPEATVVWRDVSHFTFNPATKGVELAWGAGLFAPRANDGHWLAPDRAVWDVARYLPWQHLRAAPLGATGYTLERAPEGIKVDGYIPWEGAPRFTLVYDPATGQAREWVARFESAAIERLFKLVPMDSPVVSGYAFTGAMHLTPMGQVGLKLAWKGPALALVSRSACRTLMQDRPELAGFLNDNHGHQAEVDQVANVLKIRKWELRAPAGDWDVTGEWSNQPIRCDLKLRERRRGRRPIEHLVQLN